MKMWKHGTKQSKVQGVLPKGQVESNYYHYIHELDILKATELSQETDI